MLSQIREDEKKQPVAFASRILNKAEKNYTNHKLECLALKWSVTDRFHDYLYASTFEVFTDNNTLSYVLSSAKLDATGQRRIAALQGPYNFKIHYKPGKLNQVVDSLLRIDREEEIKTITKIEVKAILDSGGTADVSIPFIGIAQRETSIITKNLQLSGIAHKS